MKHLIGIEDFSKEEINKLIEVSKDILNNKEKYNERCKGKILATLFFEPSTRTRLSFESAMLSLGGNVLGFSSSDSSSVTKGETLSDTIKVVSGYADIIAMRHPKEGSALVASNNSKVPVINAGDGGHNHPTQTLLDLLTISKEKGRLDNFTIGLCGDLKFGRTVHSLITALSNYNNIKFILISPKELKIPDYLKQNILDKNNIEYEEIEVLEECI
ncbi:MAG: aspartate carbamoyltransferase, partial [Clostridia bacterium]|nr:aspartate carbamoyltransferase [Clostridia bacterium]